MFMVDTNGYSVGIGRPYRIRPGSRRRPRFRECEVKDLLPNLTVGASRSIA